MRVLASVMLVILGLAAMGGATFAWFTSEASVDDNIFTAGTVIISAEEEVITDGINIDNWNPGDCVEKEFTIVNDGTKGIRLRGIITTQWYEPDGDGWKKWTPVGDDAAVIELIESEGWTKGEDGKYYYNESIPGEFGETSLDQRTVKLTLKVCLDGENADNQYQGKRFVVSAKFQAIQASHSDQWEWDNFSDYHNRP